MSLLENKNAGNALENMASKKFGVLLMTIYALWDIAVKQPNNSRLFVSLMCGMTIFYTVCIIIQEYIRPKKIAKELEKIK